MKASAFFIIFLLGGGATVRAQTPLYKDSHAPIDERVSDLLKRMTVEEKVAQLRSDGNPAAYENPLKTTGFGRFPVYPYRGTTPEELAEKLNDLQRLGQQNRLGIPILPYEEALHGLIDNGHTSFPQAIALAATWDPDLVHQVASDIAAETRASGVRQVLSPVINVCRDARWGRMEESYGEDPLVTSKIAVAFVSAFEKAGVVTTPKHFVANLWDGGRDSNSVNISERQLRDIYLEPFRACFQEGGSRSVMCSYNAVNGVPCASDPWLLTQILRKEYGFKGYVVSDWGAANNVRDAFHQAADYEHTAPLLLNAGMDCEDPGVLVFGKPLEDAIRDGLVSMKTLDQSVSRVLRVKFELGLFDDPMVDPAKAAALANSQEHRALALEASRKAMVLLKNDNGALPLSKDLDRIAVFGDLANGKVPLGGYSGDPGTQTSILDGLKAKEPGIQFDFVPGCAVSAGSKMPTIPASALSTPGGQAGLSGQYWSNPDFSGDPAFTRTDPQIDFDWGDGPPKNGFQHENWSARWTGFLTAPTDGGYTLSATSDDGMRVWVNEKLVLDDWGDHGAATVTVRLNFEAGHKVPIRIDYYQHGGEAVAQLGWAPEKSDDTVIRAVRSAASASDVSLVFAGIREGEGQDRAYLDLPGNQESVILAAAQSGKPVIVVLVAGAPVTMDRWIEQVPAILDAWYPGEEGPSAIADVLFGDANPGGKLPMTFPKTVGQCPLYYNFEPTGRGYDYVDSTGSPLFPFGHGLSYTAFGYSNLRISGNGPYTVSVDVTNTGKMAGDEVAQLYMHQQVSSVVVPLKSLKGFQRISLQPGETKTVTFPVGFKELSIWDVKMRRVVEPGAFDVMVGSSSGDIRLKGVLNVLGSQNLK